MVTVSPRVRTLTFWMTGSSGTQFAAPAVHGLRQAPPLQVSPSPHGWPSQSVSRQSGKPSQSSSVPPEQDISLVATGMHMGPEGPPSTLPTTLCVSQPTSSNAASPPRIGKTPRKKVFVLISYVVVAVRRNVTVE